MKKHLWLAIGGIAILIAVATIAYLAGKRSRPSTHDDVEVTISVGTPENPMSGSPSAQTHARQQHQTVLTGRCPTCGGRGYLDDPTYCVACFGAGKVIIVRRAGYMGRIPIYQRSNPTTCPICNGDGFNLLPYSRPCPTCGGKMTSEWREYWKQQARQFFWSNWWSKWGEYIEFPAD
jgi:DnaJ-class molecular chaperone